MNRSANRSNGFIDQWSAPGPPCISASGGPFPITSTKRSTSRTRIVVPAPGSAGDPTLYAASVRFYNSAGLSPDFELRFLAGAGWKLLGSPASPRGYRYRGKDVGDNIIQRVTIRRDSIRVKGFSNYTLNESQQGQIAVRLFLGDMSWCTDSLAKATGNPPSTAYNDRPGKFTAQSKTPAPIACPPEPGGSPSAAFIDAAE